jgi:hypothetical protein
MDGKWMKELDIKYFAEYLWDSVSKFAKKPSGNHTWVAGKSIILCKFPSLKPSSSSGIFHCKRWLWNENQSSTILSWDLSRKDWDWTFKKLFWSSTIGVQSTKIWVFK